MTKASFYIIDSDKEERRIALVCLLISKAFEQNQQVFLYFDSVELMNKVDQALWSIAPDSFIPHTIIESNKEINSLDSIDLSMNTPDLPKKELLINLSNSLPHFAKEYERVIEILTQQSELLNSGRERYREYRTLGFEMEMHNV